MKIVHHYILEVIIFVLKSELIYYTMTFKKTYLNFLDVYKVMKLFYTKSVYKNIESMLTF